MNSFIGFFLKIKKSLCVLQSKYIHPEKLQGHRKATGSGRMGMGIPTPNPVGMVIGE